MSPVTWYERIFVVVIVTFYYNLSSCDIIRLRIVCYQMFVLLPIEGRVVTQGVM